MLDEVFATGEPVKGQAARFDVTWAEGQAPDERYVDFVLISPYAKKTIRSPGSLCLGSM